MIRPATVNIFTTLACQDDAFDEMILVRVRNRSLKK